MSCLFIRIFLGRPRFAVYPPRPVLNFCYLLVDHNLWSTLHAIIVSPRLIFFGLIFGRPWFMVYLPCTVCNHDFYNVLQCYLLVDRNLWSTLHAIIVSAFIFFNYTYVHLRTLLVDRNLWSTLHTSIQFYHVLST